MFVSKPDLEMLTGKFRYAAQARVLDSLGLKYTRREDGSVALRQAELNAHSLTAPRPAASPRRA
jgi:hypothetical protein